MMVDHHASWNFGVFGMCLVEGKEEQSYNNLMWWKQSYQICSNHEFQSQMQMKTCWF